MKHDHKIISFNKGETTLISGDSESGKTSILCAIAWCLYGKMQKVYRGEVDKVYVRMEMSELIIYRQARPGRLEIIKNGITLLNEAAQSVIDDEFHSKDIWLACSLIEQKKQCHLLEANYSDRLKILSALAFDEDNPKEYKLKIEAYQNKIRVKYENKIRDYEIAKRIFQQNFNKEPYTPITTNQLNLKKYEINTLMIKISEITDKISKLKVKIKNEELKSEQLNLLSKQLKELREQKNKITIIFGDPVTISNDLITLKKQLNEYDEYQKRYRDYIRLKNQLDAIPLNENIPNDICTEQSYYNIKADETRREVGKKTTEELGIEYDLDIVKENIQKHKKMIEQHNNYYPLLNILKELVKLESEGLSKPDNIITTEQIMIEKTKHDEMKKGTDVLTCPHCSKSVKYSKGKLIESHIHKYSESDIKKQFDFVKNRYKKFQTQNDTLNTLNKIEELKSKIPNRSILNDYKPIKIDESYRIISKLEQIQIIEQPNYKSSDIRMAINRLKLINKINKEYSDFEENVDLMIDRNTLNQKIYELTILHTNIINQRKEIEKLDSMIELIEERIQNIILDPTIIDIYQQNINDLKNYETKLKENQLFCSENEALIKLELIKTDYNTLLEKMNALNSLIKKTITLSYKLLDDTVNSISTQTKPILNKIFDKSVVLELKLFKDVKKGSKKSEKYSKTIKHMVNLDVYFDAQKHEKRMCGGEIDRISIALLLALNNNSHSPFIIMDEVLSTVSSEVAGKCIKQIKKYTKDKYVICIEHNVVSGLYDRVIKM